MPLPSQSWSEREEYIRHLKAEHELYRTALENLMKFGERLMDSKVMEDRGIGLCVCEGARVVREKPDQPNRTKDPT